MGLRGSQQFTAGSSLEAQQRFAEVEAPQIQRSTFDRSSGTKTTLAAGKVVPVYVDEVLPGDTIQLDAAFFGRLQTLIGPVMDNLYLDVHFFFVPNRLLWEHWQRFCGEQPNPGDSTDFLVPVMTSPSGGYLEHSLSDYFGLPTRVAGIEHSALWHRAYNRIWNEWYRDQDLQDAVPVPVDDGPDDPADYVVLPRAKRHDYFTSCRPWPQKGVAVSLPLGITAPVVSAGTGIPKFGTGAGTNANKYLTYGLPADEVHWGPAGAASGSRVPMDWLAPELAVDLTTATAATINQLREAFQVQRLLERDARGGTRYVELLLSHFGVVSSDARLQRSEYLGGGSVPILMQAVAQTSRTETIFNPLGRLGAYGVAAGGSPGFTRSFEEHGVLIGVVSFRADLNYQQGLARMWSRQTRFEFYWPTLAHLGEQAVLSKELYCDGTSGDEDVFGYQERWSEYRYKPSMITGYLRSQATTSLDVWHLAQEFGDRPVLGDEFIREAPPLGRVQVVVTDAQLTLDCHFRVLHARAMPTYSTPGLIDHF